MNNEGWKCPECGKVWSPYVPSCLNCQGYSDINYLKNAPMCTTEEFDAPRIPEPDPMDNCTNTAGSISKSKNVCDRCDGIGSVGCPQHGHSSCCSVCGGTGTKA